MDIILDQEKDLNSYLYRELNIFSGGTPLHSLPTTLKCLFCQNDIDIGNMDEAVIYVCDCGGVVIWGEEDKEEEIKQIIINYFNLLYGELLDFDGISKNNFNVSKKIITNKNLNKTKTILFVKYNNINK